MKWIWRGAEFLAWAAFFAVCAFVLALRYWVLPDIESYHGRIVEEVSKSVGLPVKIGRIQAGWSGFRPQLALSDVRVFDEQGREALVLPEIDNVLSWRSFLLGELALHSLVIDGPRLSVRREADGTLFVAGLKLAGGAAESPVSDWVLGQDEIQVRNAEIDWQDEKRGAPPLTLSALNLRLRNSGIEHRLGISAKPPMQLGSTLDLRAELAGRSLNRLDNWNGRLYVELGYTDLAGWRAWVDYPIDVSRGQGAVRAWATLVNGTLKEATADVALVDVSARLGKDLPPVELSAVTGRIQASTREGGYQLAGRQLALVSRRGRSMDPTDFQLAWAPAGAAPEHGSFSSKRLELVPLSRLAETLPLPEGVRKTLSDVSPRGRVLEASLDWTGPLEAPQKLSAKAKFERLGAKPWGEFPGFSGLSGSIEASETKASLHLASRRAEIDVPRVLTDPRVALDTLDGDIAVERSGPAANAVKVDLASLSFSNADLEGKASGSYAWRGEGRGLIDLEATLKRADGARVVRYLPLAEVMGASVHDYLAKAIVSGKASDVRLKLKGDLADFPFHDPAKGDFRVSAHVADGVLEYVPGWPRITGIDADLLFERERMLIAGRSGSVLGAKLSGVQVAIADLGARPAHVSVSGEAQGPTAEFLHFVSSSPVRGMIGGFTDGVRAEGQGKLRLKLDVPLDDPTQTKVAGQYDLLGDSVTLHAGVPPIERANGRVLFTESTLSFRDMRGRFLGGPVSIVGGSKPGAGVEVQARGDATVAAAQALVDNSWKRYFSGATSYAATVSVQAGSTRIAIDSSLRGVSSGLPPPFAKAAGDALPMHAEIFPASDGSRDRVSVRLGRIAAIELLRAKEGEAMALQRASLWLTPSRGQPLRLPERPGTLVYGSLPQLDVDRWLALADADPKPAQATATPAASSAATPAASSAPATGESPFNFDLSVGTLDAFGKRVHAAQVKGGADASGWSATIESEEMGGQVSYQEEKGGQVVARMAHFRIPEDYPGAKPDARAERSKELPSVDFIADRFTLRGKQLGRLELLARRASDDWRLDKLALINPEASVSGTGVWHPGAGAGGSQTSLNLDLESSDGGKFLARLGYPGLVRGARSRMQATISWAGDPTAIDYSTLSGNVQLQSYDGQFLEIEPGIGKLVALMSLQALPRRLTLDFRDVFSKGFQFDKLASAADIERGVMTLKDFKMSGSAADVDMSGKVDLAHETQDLHVRVVPQLGDTASTALVLVNPLLFFPAAIAQKILKDPLGHIFAFNYSITGTWSDPKVAKRGVEAEEVPHPPQEQAAPEQQASPQPPQSPQQQASPGK